MATDAAATLRDLLTPSLFSLLVRARIPHSPSDDVDFDRLGPYIFGSSTFRETVSPAAWPALIALSKVDLSSSSSSSSSNAAVAAAAAAAAESTDLTAFLPDPTDPSYPEQCLGLQLLVDQCPRALFRGRDRRWTGKYFDELSQRLARSWLALPAPLRPDARHRWPDATLGYVVAARMFFVCPLVHSEVAADQAAALAFTEATRRMVEEATGLTDPNRAQREELLADVHAFLRVRREGPPRGPDVDCPRWTWWMCLLMDAHKPIVDRFGRYPQKNRTAGRENTPDEEVWMAEGGRFLGSTLPEGVSVTGPLEPLGMGERG